MQAVEAARRVLGDVMKEITGVGASSAGEAGAAGEFAPGPWLASAPEEQMGKAAEADRILQAVVQRLLPPVVAKLNKGGGAGAGGGGGGADDSAADGANEGDGAAPEVQEEDEVALAEALSHMVLVRLAMGKLDEAKGVLEGASAVFEAHSSHLPVQMARAEVEKAMAAAGAEAKLAPLREAVATSPKDASAHLALGQGLR